jgi:hypothetical protein
MRAHVLLNGLQGEDIHVAAVYTLQASGWTKVSKAGKASAPAPEVPDARAAPSSGDKNDDKDLAAAIEVRPVHGFDSLTFMGWAGVSCRVSVCTAAIQRLCTHALAGSMLQVAGCRS